MKFYKDPQNKVHFLSDDDERNGGALMLPQGVQQITQAQATALLPVPTAADGIKQQIAALEATITPRRMREAILSQAGADWLASVESEVSALRKKLV